MRCRAGLGRIGTEERAGLLADSGDGYVAVVGFGRAQALRFSLMTDRAGDPVSSGCGVVRVIEWQMRKDGSVVAGSFVGEVLQGHVARGAFVLNRRSGRGVVEGLAADAGLPIGIACGVGHDARAPGRADGNVLAFRRLQVVVAAIAAGG